MPTNKIKKIKLADGSIYAIFDENALHLDEQNRLLTGNNIVDKAIINGNLSITEIDDVPIDQSIENVLVQDPTTGLIKKRSVNQLLKDIGGYTFNVQDGVLNFKIGK